MTRKRIGKIILISAIVGMFGDLWALLCLARGEMPYVGAILTMEFGMLGIIFALTILLFRGDLKDSPSTST